MWHRRLSPRPLAALIFVLSSLGAVCNTVAAEPVAMVATAETPAATMAPTDAELRSEFDARSWAYDEYVLRHIFIAVGPTPGHQKPRSEAQALARARALKRQLDTGKDFNQLAQRASDDSATAAIGGELSSLFGLYVADEFIGTVRELAIGEVSKPTRGRDGYHLILLADRHSISFEMAKPIIEEQLRGHAGSVARP